MGESGTKFYNIENFQMIKFCEKIKNDLTGNLIQKFDDDKIIFGGNDVLSFFSLSKNELVNEIEIDFACFSLYVIEDKGIFLIIGSDELIRVYRKDNFQCIQKIKGSEFGNMYGISQLKNGLIISFSEDDIIKIWKFYNFEYIFFIK
jgi:hypothetical protein